jgi:HAE1 family hydrophobic/amphiphilic exporter-1
MSIPELCIRRPVMTTLVMAGLVLFGLFAYRVLPVAELPNVDFPTIEVTGRLPGANPETMAASVATPLEKQFSRIAGVRAMTSVSSEGSTRITLEFELERNIDAAALDVQSAISATMRSLPADLSEPPAFRKVNPADFPIFFLAMKSLALPISQVNEFAENVVSPRLSTIDGVAQLQIWGAQKYAVRVQINPDALVTRGIGFDEVERVLRASNSYQPTGSLSGTDQTVSTKTTGQLMDAAAFNQQIIKYVGGAPVRLQDVGRAVDSVEDNKASTWYRGDVQGLMMVIYRQPGSNTVEIVNRINAYLPQLRAQVPPSIDLDVLYDRSNSIREGIHDVQFSLVLAAGLVVLVIFLFLRSISATIIASIALPISVIGTFALMQWWGFSLNNLTLMALTLAVGFVVDDAIVMLENIVRHREKGLSAWDAAIIGSREIGFTILSMTISLVAVFIPIIFMQGMIGRLLHEFALTITAAILVSGLVSLTLTPMMCSRFVRSHGHGNTGALFRWSERVFEGMLALYKRSLDFCIRHKAWVLASFIATILATWHFYGYVQKDFLPEEDSGRILALTEAGQDASYEATVRAQKQVAALVLADPNIDDIMSRVGASGPSATANTGIIFMRLKPRASRPEKDVRVIVQKLRAKLNTVPGIKAFVTNPPIIRVGGRLSNAAYQYTLQDVDLESLYRWADVMVAELRRLDGFQDVVTDLKIASPSVMMRINRDRAAALGIAPDKIESTLASAFGTRRISTIYTSSSQYAVIIEIDPAFQQDTSSLKKLYVSAPATVGPNAQPARLVPLDALVDMKRDVTSLTVSHQGQLPAVTISFNLATEVSLGTAIDRIREVERRLQMPATLSTSFAGTAQVFESSMKGMGLLLLMAILVVYIVLGILYESFIHPLTILSGLPAAGLGALLTLMYFNTPLTLYAFVGIIMLVGIVKKNAIMMIDFALSAQREQGMVPEKAIYEACLVRFRPIMMTTFAALAGALPIAMGFGQGGEARAPLGLTVVGGLLVSQIITLYLTPVVYIYLDRLQSMGRRSTRSSAELPGLGEPVPAGASRKVPDAAE